MKKLTLCICLIIIVHFNTLAALSVTLTASNYNGYNISCFGFHDGSITAHATGGAPPYTYEWSNAASTATIGSLASGFYSVRVIDANMDFVIKEITLTEPLQITSSVVPNIYGNGFNLTCFYCGDGTVATNVDGGVTPYSFIWNDGSTLQNRNSLQAKYYYVIISDANSCTQKEVGVSLSAPARDDWQMNGNTGSNPATEFLGTIDNTDLVFKTYNSERLRMKNNGDIKINSFVGGSTISLVTVNSSGILGSKGIVLPTTSCTDPLILNWQWKTSVTPNVAYTCWTTVGIGTDDPQKNLGVKGGARFFNFSDHSKYVDVEHDGANASINSTDNILMNYYSGKNIYMNTGTTKGNVETGGNTYLATDVGKRVGIGTTSPTQKLEVEHTDADGGIAINQNDLTNAHKKSEIKFNLKGVEQWAIGSNLDNNGINSFFIWNHSLVPGQSYSWGTAFFVDGTTNNIGIGTEHPGSFKLAVEGKIAAREIKVTIDNPFPDYVFAKDYNLMSIYELDNYIKANNHLPQMPSAAEVEKNNGVEVGDMLTKLIKQNEEQTLYIIALQKQVDELKLQLPNQKGRK